MLYHAGPSSLVFFAECLKWSRIVIYRSKVIRFKCSLNRSYINYRESHCDSVNSSLVFSVLKIVCVFWLERVLQPSVFLKIVCVFWLERVVPPLVIASEQSFECFVISILWSKRVRRADRKADVNQTCQQSLFSPIRACIRIWCTAGAVERRSQMFVHRPFRFPLSLVPRSTKGLFTGYARQANAVW